jgi:hypothetical protein
MGVTALNNLGRTLHAMCNSDIVRSLSASVRTILSVGIELQIYRKNRIPSLIQFPVFGQPPTQTTRATGAIARVHERSLGGPTTAEIHSTWQCGGSVGAVINERRDILVPGNDVHPGLRDVLAGQSDVSPAVVDVGLRVVVWIGRIATQHVVSEDDIAAFTDKAVGCRVAPRRFARGVMC